MGSFEQEVAAFIVGLGIGYVIGGLALVLVSAFFRGSK